MPSVEVKSYYVNELARLYTVSETTFRAWIRRYREDLEKLGWKDGQKVLTPAIVRFLFDKLGEP